MFKSKNDSMVEDSFNAFLVEGANFTSLEEYPILEKGMIASKLPEKIMPFSKAITFQGDLSHTVVYFFSADKTFERVRRNPKRYINFFKKTAGIMGFDFSVHSDMPVIKQKAQLNDNLSLSYFYGKNGIPIYPAPRGGSDSTIDEYLSSFPKRTLIAVGVHGFVKEKSQKSEWYYWLNILIERLNPVGIIVVGHLTNSMFDELKLKVPFYFYDSLIEERRKEVKIYGNQRAK